MRDIAKAVGISQAAVSKALSGKPGVSPATRERVLAAAKELGYHPDPRLASLSERRWRENKAPNGDRLAALIGESLLPTHEAMLASLRRRAEQLGYGLEVISIQAGKAHPDFERLLRARGIQGAVLMEGVLVQEIRNFEPRELALVDCSVFARMRPHHGVVPDLVMASHHICRLIEELDFRRVAFATFADTQTLMDVLRRAAIGQIRERHPQRILPDPVYTVQDPADHDSFTRWLSRKQPDLLVTVNNHFQWIMKDNGIQMPADCATICLLIAGNEDGITGFRRNDDLIGKRAVDMLATSLARLEFGRPPAPEIVSVTGLWQEGSSLR